MNDMTKRRLADIINRANGAVEREVVSLRIAFILINVFTLSVGFGGIQEDINALGSVGGTVTIPAGITIVSNTIKIPNNITLEGCSANSVLKADVGLNAPVIQNSNVTGGNSGIRLSGFKIDGGSGSSRAGISLVNCNNIVIKEVQSCNCTDGIEIIGSSYNIVIRQCRLYSNGRAGISSARGNGIKLDGSAADMYNIVITGCTIYSNYFSGIHAREMKNIRIYNNYIYDQDKDALDPFSGDDSIKLYRCDRIIAFANRLDESRNCGIEFWGSSYYTAVANDITKSNDGLHGGISGGVAGNGCALYHTGSSYYGQGYVMLANACHDNVFAITQENNTASEGNPNAVIASNSSNYNERHGLHHITCFNTISIANINRANGKYNPPEEGTENCGAILSGCKNLGFYSNLIFDYPDTVRDDMYGVLVRVTSDSILSDNIAVDSEIIDWRVEEPSKNNIYSENIYHNPIIRFVVSNAVAPANVDTAIKSMLEGLGYTVNYYNESSDPGTITEDLIIISGTVTSSRAPLTGAAYRNSTVPIVILHPEIMTSMELSDVGSSSSQTNINIISLRNHMTSFLLNGSANVASASSFGYVTGNVIGTKLASIVGDSGKNTVVAIEKNTPDQLNTLVPARRAFLFLYSNTYNSLNSNGLAVFRRGVEWALGAE